MIFFIHANVDRQKIVIFFCAYLWRSYLSNQLQSFVLLNSKSYSLAKDHAFSSPNVARNSNRLWSPISETHRDLKNLYHPQLLLWIQKIFYSILLCDIFGTFTMQLSVLSPSCFRRSPIHQNLAIRFTASTCY
jgi:hypothetical protein